MDFFKGFDFLKYIREEWRFLAFVIYITGGLIYVVFEKDIFSILNQKQTFIFVILLGFVIIFMVVKKVIEKTATGGKNTKKNNTTEKTINMTINFKCLRTILEEYYSTNEKLDTLRLIIWNSEYKKFLNNDEYNTTESIGGKRNVILNSFINHYGILYSIIEQDLGIRLADKHKCK